MKTTRERYNQSVTNFVFIFLILSQALADEGCVSLTKTFTVTVDLYASQLGYYQFEECGDALSPSLHLEIGETYTFLQNHRTNYYKPFGFVYPSGDQADREYIDMSPDTTGNDDSDCAETSSCTTPMYYMNSRDSEQHRNLLIGVDQYDTILSGHIPDWASNDYSVTIRFTEEDVGSTIYYFMRIHEAVGGRIKLMQDGIVIQDSKTSLLPDDHVERSDFDQQCGTVDLSEFQLPNAQCQDRFVCGAEEGELTLQDFSSCIEAMNCYMMRGMTTGVKAQDEMALFIHQMIPHHHNAINMAKALLKVNSLDCPDLAEKTQDCKLEAILYNIINTQLYQIKFMNEYLEAKGLRERDDCIVEVETITIDGEQVSGSWGSSDVASGCAFSSAVLGAVLPF